MFNFLRFDGGNARFLSRRKVRYSEGHASDVRQMRETHRMLEELRRENEELRAELATLRREHAKRKSPKGCVSDRNAEKQLFAATGYSIDTRKRVEHDIPRLRELLEAGRVNANARDNLGNSPLAHAAGSGLDEVVLVLIEHRVDLDAENLDGATPLTYAVCSNQLSAPALLLAAGANSE